MQLTWGRTSGQGAAIRKVMDASQERKDQLAAERASRIMQSDVWQHDFYPLITALYDAWLEKVKKGTGHIDSLKVLDDLVALVDGSVQVGAGALNRIAERRLRASEVKKSIDEAVAQP
jgi:hypothetical protein